jgi:hypothetical protein
MRPSTQIHTRNSLLVIQATMNPIRRGKSRLMHAAEQHVEELKASGVLNCQPSCVEILVMGILLPGIDSFECMCIA